MAFVHHRVAEITLFGQKGDAVGGGEGGQQAGQHDAAAQLDGAVARQLCFEGARGEHGHGGVEQAEQQGGTRHAQPGREHQREQQRHGQRAQVVEGEHFGHQVFKVGLAPVQHAHHQRDFHAHHDAHHQHQRIQQRAERRGSQPEHHKQHQGRHPADDAHQQFDFDKARKRVFIADVFGEVRADAHGEEIEADDGGKLQNAVAQQITGQRGNDEFIRQPAAGHDENGDNEGAVGFHVSGNLDDGLNYIAKAIPFFISP